jgi:hypothetical protein
MKRLYHLHCQHDTNGTTEAHYATLEAADTAFNTASTDAAIATVTLIDHARGVKLKRSTRTTVRIMTFDEAFPDTGLPTPLIQQEAIKTAFAPRTKTDRRTAAKQLGYEGDDCRECGNFTLVRNGTCLKCNTCGGTSGCS